MLVLTLALQVAAAASGQAALDQIHNFVRISDRLATSGQMTYEQIDAIAGAGFDVVVNLAPAREERNGFEPFRMAQHGITYVNIPVSWQEPSLRDLDMFFAVMDANKDRNVYVHCFANMRASAFTYLWRTLSAGVEDAEAREAMDAVWDPWDPEHQSPQWGAFIDAAKERGVRH